jgi:hypothetical protein
MVTTNVKRFRDTTPNSLRLKIVVKPSTINRATTSTEGNPLPRDLLRTHPEQQKSSLTTITPHEPLLFRGQPLS